MFNSWSIEDFVIEFLEAQFLTGEVAGRCFYVKEPSQRVLIGVYFEMGTVQVRAEQQHCPYDC